ncbi:MAG: ABC transporter permease subunit [Ignavibacteriaceae bacterium]|jgi:polar amino acid transport system permease protein|nr:ABC transporter permease subunit [Ignavibacteriaceae bacterium]
MFELIALLAFGDKGWGDELLKGLGVTIALAFATVPFALFCSFLVAWSKQSPYKLLRMAGNAYTTVFRSLPEILTLIIIYYQLQAIINFFTSTFLPGISIGISPFIAGMIALTLVFSALGSEVVRAAYSAVGKGQMEAAYSVSLSRRKAFFYVILPQMWQHMLPAFGNLWLILLKDTSLVSIIALSEIVRYTNMAIATTKEPFFFYSVLATVYVVLSFISGRVQTVMEKRVNKNLVSEH